MKSFDYEIKDPMGLHARPAGVMVKMVSQLPCKVTLTVNGKTADAKKIIAVMGLGAKQGHNIRVEIDGEGEDDAFVALQKFFEENF